MRQASGNVNIFGNFTYYWILRWLAKYGLILYSTIIRELEIM